MILSVLLVFICILLVYIWYKVPAKLALPGPRGAPIIGNLLQLDANNPHEHLTHWAKQYGDVYTLTLMWDRWLVVSGYDALMDVLVKRGSLFADRPKILRGAYPTFGNNDIIWMDSYKHYYQVGKKIVHHSLKQYSEGIERIEQVTTTMLTDMMAKLQKLQGRACNPKDYIYKFTIRNLLYFSIGKFVDDDDDLCTMFETMERLIITAQTLTGEGSELDAFPWLRHLGNSTFKKLQRWQNLVINVWKKVSPELKESLDPDNQRCLMEALMVAQQTDPQITDVNIRSTMMDVVVAGTTTTSNTLAAFINLLTFYPDIQTRIQQEVDDVVGRSRPVSVRDREKMHYTRAVIYELNRYVSVVPLGVPHTTSADVTLAGTTVPKGTHLLMNTWALHHDEKYWGDPWRFRPERFLDDEGCVVPADHENRKHLMPFGAGSRVCIGEIFAMTRMFLFIGNVLQQFTVKPVESRRASCDPRDYILGIALAPEDFEVEFLQRN